MSEQATLDGARTETPAPEPPPKGLAAKLVAAALSIDNVEKAGKNTQQNYNYAKAEDVADAATTALLAKGIVSEFECIGAEQLPIRSKSGTDGLIATVTCRLVVTDSESGESTSRMAMGSGSDYPGDKAIYKAMTGARKYAFIHLLGIPIGDDPDDERGNGRRQSRRATPKPANPLPAERVNTIGKGIGALGLTYGQIDQLLGAAGINGLRAASSKALRERLESLASDEADALETEMGKVADQG